MRSDMAALWPEVRVEGWAGCRSIRCPRTRRSDRARPPRRPCRQTPIAPQPPAVSPADPDAPAGGAGRAGAERVAGSGRTCPAVGGAGRRGASAVIAPVAVVGRHGPGRRQASPAAPPARRADPGRVARGGAWAVANDVATDAGLAVHDTWTDRQVVAAAATVAVGADVRPRTGSRDVRRGHVRPGPRRRSDAGRDRQRRRRGRAPCSPARTRPRRGRLPREHAVAAPQHPLADQHARSTCARRPRPPLPAAERGPMWPRSAYRTHLTWAVAGGLVVVVVVVVVVAWWSAAGRRRRHGGGRGTVVVGGGREHHRGHRRAGRIGDRVAEHVRRSHVRRRGGDPDGEPLGHRSVVAPAPPSSRRQRIAVGVEALARRARRAGGTVVARGGPRRPDAGSDGDRRRIRLPTAGIDDRVRERRGAAGPRGRRGARDRSPTLAMVSCPPPSNPADAGTACRRIGSPSGSVSLSSRSTTTAPAPDVDRGRRWRSARRRRR